MSELADKFEEYFAKQELIPIKVNGAQWLDPARAVSNMIKCMRASREGSDAFESYRNHLNQYRNALREHKSSQSISELTISEKVAQMQNKSKSIKSLKGTELP
jgi:hypothetical protein